MLLSYLTTFVLIAGASGRGGSGLRCDFEKLRWSEGVTEEAVWAESLRPEVLRGRGLWGRAKQPV